MKEVKAFVHRNRGADIVHALLDAGFAQLSLVDVKGTLEAITPAEADYSVEFGEAIVTEVKIEVVCADADIDRVIDIFKTKGHSRRASGWLYVSDIERGLSLDPS